MVSRLGWGSPKGCPSWQCCCLPGRQGSSLTPTLAGHPHFLPRKKVKGKGGNTACPAVKLGYAACSMLRSCVLYSYWNPPIAVCTQPSFLWILLPHVSCSCKRFFLAPSCLLCQPLQGISVEGMVEVSPPPWLPPSHSEGSSQHLYWRQMWGFATAGASA